jgi:undecaprenyl-diphosphatase
MDQQLLFLINREWTSPWADVFMAAVTSWAVWIPFTVIAAVVLIVRGRFRMRAFIVCALLVVAVNDAIVARTLKRAVDRPRPHQAMSDVRIVDLAKATPRILAVFKDKPVKVKMSRQELGDVDGRSFPSSHTMNTFSVAFVALCIFGARAAWLLGIAALVSYSRIYVGVHFPSDVITSIFLAGGTTLLLMAGLDALWRRRGARWLPEVHARHPRLLAA